MPNDVREKGGSLSVGIMRNCYATGWSYGEICVGCNACGRIDKDKIKVNKAKLSYAKYEMQRLNHFNSWGNTKDLIALQKKNITQDKKYWREEIKKINRILTDLRARLEKR